MLLPRTVADLIANCLDGCYCPYVFEVVISHFLADIGPMLLNNVLADVITKFNGRSYCQF